MKQINKTNLILSNHTNLIQLHDEFEYDQQRHVAFNTYRWTNMNYQMTKPALTNWVCLLYLEYVWYGVIIVFPLLSVKVLELGGIFVFTLICHVSPHVELGFGLNRNTNNMLSCNWTVETNQVIQPKACPDQKRENGSNIFDLLGEFSLKEVQPPLHTSVFYCHT